MTGNGLDRLLINEPDLALRRRTRLLFDWLDTHPRGSLLDVPCGRGYHLALLHRLGRRSLLGVDIDADTLAVAEKATASLAGISLCRSAVDALPAGDSSFDLVLCSEGLEHFEDDHAALVEIYRVMRPGALLAISVPNQRYPLAWDPLNRALESITGRHISSGPLAGIWANHLRLYDRDALQRVVSGAGFVVEETRSLTHHCFPFSHNLLYGIGKPLVERSLLPETLSRALDRSEPGPEPVLDRGLIGAAFSIFGALDRFNSMDEPVGRTSVNLCLRARKPG